MYDYYDNKYSKLISDLGYCEVEALNEIMQIYLDDKPKKIKNKNVQRIHRDECFWNSRLLKENKDTFFATSLYAMVLSKNFKSEYIHQIDMIKESSINYSLAITQAIKFSKIFLDKDTKKYRQLKDSLDKNKFEDFFKICDGIALRYRRLKEGLKDKEKLLMDYGYVDLLFVMSLSSLKYTSINVANPSYFSIYSMILTTVLQDRIKKKDRRKRAIEEAHIREKIKKFFMPNKNKNEVPVECERFEEIFKAYEALILFEQNELYTFLYDENYKATLDHDKIILSPIDMKKHIKTEMHSEKLQGMFKYYEEEVMIVLPDKFQNDYKGQAENRDMNFFQSLRIGQTQLIMSEIFGLNDDVFIDDAKTLNVRHLVYAGYAFSTLYAFEFLKIYLSVMQKHGIKNWWQSHIEIIQHSMLTHKKNRSPLIYKTMRKVILEVEGNQKIDFGEKIIDFWSHDLRAEKNNTVKYPAFFEKPFIKIDDFVFIFPWLMSFSGASPMTFINSLLRVHTNRMEQLEDGKKNNVRKDEVGRSEKNLAKLFMKLGFKVKDGYTSENAKKYGVQDMDIVASKDGHLFILELKSTYIRESLEGNWIYKTGAIRKAGNQLKKRKKYIETLLVNEDKDFIEQFDRPEHIHTWIVDTSFESDHEYFDGSLKVSMFEVIYALNETNQEFYCDGFSANSFVENIKSAKLWEKIDKPKIRKEEATYII